MCRISEIFALYLARVSDAEMIGGPLDGETLPMWREVGSTWTYASCRYGLVTYQRIDAYRARHLNTQSTR